MIITLVLTLHPHACILVSILVQVAAVRCLELSSSRRLMPSLKRRLPQPLSQADSPGQMPHPRSGLPGAGVGPERRACWGATFTWAMVRWWQLGRSSRFEARLTVYAKSRDNVGMEVKVELCELCECGGIMPFLYYFILFVRHTANARRFPRSDIMQTHKSSHTTGGFSPPYLPWPPAPHDFEGVD
jgi:hypothetical protein